jgi:hypothetical protein
MLPFALRTPQSAIADDMTDAQHRRATDFRSLFRHLRPPNFRGVYVSSWPGADRHLNQILPAGRQVDSVSRRSEPLRLSPASDRSRCIASVQPPSAVTNLCESLRTVSNRRKLYSMVAERHWKHWQGSNRCLGRVSVVLAGWFGVESALSAILLSGPLNLHGGVRAHGHRIGISEAV